VVREWVLCWELGAGSHWESAVRSPSLSHMPHAPEWVWVWVVHLHAAIDITKTTGGGSGYWLLAGGVRDTHTGRARGLGL
jgi:hypothetical protein